MKSLKKAYVYLMTNLVEKRLGTIDFWFIEFILFFVFFGLSLKPDLKGKILVPS
jgi:hypothetical protein